MNLTDKLKIHIHDNSHDNKVSRKVHILHLCYTPLLHWKQWIQLWNPHLINSKASWTELWKSSISWNWKKSRKIPRLLCSSKLFHEISLLSIWTATYLYVNFCKICRYEYGVKPLHKKHYKDLWNKKQPRKIITNIQGINKIPLHKWREWNFPPEYFV